MSEDVDVNDDGLVDLIVPTKPCPWVYVTPPREHGPHLTKDFALPPNWWRCPGYEAP